MVSSMYS